jgi:hypothetical protein
MRVAGSTIFPFFFAGYYPKFQDCFMIRAYSLPDQNPGLSRAGLKPGRILLSGDNETGPGDFRAG